jgi:cytochrome c-type biogenesis protein CcsB
MYESFVFAAWTMALIYLVFEYTYKFKMPGAVIAPFVAALLLFASFSKSVNPAIQELPSVLQGNLFAYHAIASTAAFGCFIMSFVVSIVIVVMGGQRPEGSKIRHFFSSFARENVLDELSYKAIAVGFLLYTIGMATGAYRCKIIWGKYWSWDPSEISSLIMWLMYAVILHGRYQRWWSARATAMLSIVALITSVLCFLISAGLMLTSMHYPIN